MLTVYVPADEYVLLGAVEVPTVLVPSPQKTMALLAMFCNCNVRTLSAPFLVVSQVVTKPVARAVASSLCVVTLRFTVA